MPSTQIDEQQMHLDDCKLYTGKVIARLGSEAEKVFNKNNWGQKSVVY